MFLSNYQENASANNLPNTLYLAAVTNWPGETGGQTNLLAARLAVEMDAAAAGQRVNTNQEDGTIGAAGRARFFEAWDAVSAGNYLGYAILGNDLISPFVVDTTEVANNNIISPFAALTVATNDEVVFLSMPGVALPAGITEGNIYAIVGSPSNSRFQVSATQGGAALDITGTGSGLVCKIGYKDYSQNDTLRINAGQLFSLFH